MDLDDVPQYLALSYSWIKDLEWHRMFLNLIVPSKFVSYRSEKKRFVFCNRKCMAVRENLYNCVLQLRESYPQTYFWIDAVCINQADVQERNSQVLHMARIYGSAEKVIAWLGTCPAYFERTGAIQYFGGEVTVNENATTQNIWVRSRREGPAGLTLATFYLLPVYVLSRRYFRRAWILQEAILPRNLVFLFGSHVKTPEEILSGIESLNKYPSLVTFLQNFTDLFVALLDGSVQRTRNLLENRKRFDIVNKWRLEQYLITCSGYEATDPRDLIFAGLGLFDHGRLIIDDIEHNDPDEDTPVKLWTEFRVDYSASIRDVYINFTAALITEIGIRALSFGRAEENGQNLPSWVPSFDGRSRREPFRDEIGITFRAGGHSESSNLSISSGKSLLILRGGARILDTINKSFSLSLFETTYAHDLTDFLASQPQVYDKTRENMANATARTLVADFLGGQQTDSARLGIYLIEWLKRTVWMKSGRRVHIDGHTRNDGERIHEREDLPSRQESFVSLIERHDLKLDPETAWYTGASLDFDGQQDNKEANFRLFVDIFHQRCYGRALFVTERGFIGIGPGYANALDPGNKVMIPKGADVPYAVKPFQDINLLRGGYTDQTSIPVYNLIGEVYVHGVMQGEAVQEVGWQELALA